MNNEEKERERNKNNLKLKTMDLIFFSKYDCMLVFDRFQFRPVGFLFV